MIDRYAIIVAGGAGKRFGAPIPKQYVKLGGIPILLRTLRQVRACVPNENIVLVIPQCDFDAWLGLCARFGEVSPVLAASGSSRFHSVLSGIEALKSLPTAPDADALIAVHDGVRPLADCALFERGFECARATRAAVPVIPVIDSIRRVEADHTEALNRNTLRAVQTPQIFNYELLQSAYAVGFRPEFTDDASVVENAGAGIHVFDGDIRNIKITNKVDIVLAEYYLDGDQC